MHGCRLSLCNDLFLPLLVDLINFALRPKVVRDDFLYEIVPHILTDEFLI